MNQLEHLKEMVSDYVNVTKGLDKANFIANTECGGHITVIMDKNTGKEYTVEIKEIKEMEVKVELEPKISMEFYYHRN